MTNIPYTKLQINHYNNSCTQIIKIFKFKVLTILDTLSMESKKYATLSAWKKIAIHQEHHEEKKYSHYGNICFEYI